MWWGKKDFIVGEACVGYFHFLSLLFRHFFRGSLCVFFYYFLLLFFLSAGYGVDFVLVVLVKRSVE